MIEISDGGYRAVVDESVGALIYSIHDDQGFDLLAEGNPPNSALRERHDLGATGYRGWIDCFPTIDAESDETNGRPALRLGGHGELWPRTWTVDEVTDDAITLSLRLDEWGVDYTRRIAFVQGALVASSTISNRTDLALNYVWASHALLAVDDSSWIELANVDVSGWPEAAGDSRSTLDEVWPSDSDRRRWSELPDGFARKLFMPWPAKPILFSSGGRTRSIAFTATGEDQVAHLGLWINRGGFPGERPLSHLAIEPTIGSTDSLTQSHARGTSGRLAATSGVTFDVTLTL